MGKVRFTTVIQRSQRAARRFAEHDPKPWPPEVKVVDLQARIGIIAQAILERQGFKSSKRASKALAQELATVFFILLDLADTYDINFDGAFTDFLEETERSLASQKG